MNIRFLATLFGSLALCCATGQDLPKIDDTDALRIQLVQSDKKGLSEEYDKITAQIANMQNRQQELQKQWADKNLEESSLTEEAFRKAKLDRKTYELDLKARTFKKITPPNPGPTSPSQPPADAKAEKKG